MTSGEASGRETVSETGEELIMYLRHPQCTIMRRRALTWNSDNSEVMSIPFLDAGKILEKSIMFNVAASLVQIRGLSHDPLHYHRSHLIGVVVDGRAMLRHIVGSSREESISEVIKGDVVLIPRGVYHLFNCEEGECMSYVALEISDEEIDYQKHWQ